MWNSVSFCLHNFRKLVQIVFCFLFQCLLCIISLFFLFHNFCKKLSILWRQFIAPPRGAPKARQPKQNLLSQPQPYSFGIISWLCLIFCKFPLHVQSHELRWMTLYSTRTYSCATQPCWPTLLCGQCLTSVHNVCGKIEKSYCSSLLCLYDDFCSKFVKTFEPTKKY